MKKWLLLSFIVLLAGSVCSQTIWKSPWFIIVYGKDIKLDGIPMLVGDTIKMYSQKGIYCGVGVLEANKTYFNTILRYCPIYGDDPYQKGDNGLHIGDTVKFVAKYKEIIGVDRFTDRNQYAWHEKTVYSIYPEGQLNYIICDTFSTLHQIYTLTSSCCQKRGDVNLDGEIDIADFTLLQNYLFISFTPLKCFEAADVNADGQIDIADYTLLIDFLFINLTPLEPCK